MQVLNQIAGNKRKKKEEGWELEDRELGKRYKEAQISNLYETTQPREVKPTSKVSPQMVKSMMTRLDYPQEVIAEVDTMNEPALSAAWAKTQSDFASRQLQGIKVPRTAATQKGRIQYQRLKAALDTVKARKRVSESSLIQLLGNPERTMLSESRIEQLQGQAEEVERQEGEIASMINSLDENGELSEEQLRDLYLILKWQVRYKTTKRPLPQTDAEKKLPAGFAIQK
jgi:hypothetical protein